ncbi:MAG: hypothetical protein DHS20C21_24180 [Gemmatimonadota bacterium]|nr:MAG: hypothetical protein DHS20C21_24180 [Gemmatimonadota bacterium]
MRRPDTKATLVTVVLLSVLAASAYVNAQERKDSLCELGCAEQRVDQHRLSLDVQDQ